MLAVILADAPQADIRSALPLLSSTDLLIAADGGARHALNHGVTPHVIIGDLDSIQPAMLEIMQARKVEILRFPAAKNETDLELALLLAVERGADQIRILAALGGRPDMHMANQLLLTHPSLIGRDVALLDGAWEVRLIRQHLEFQGKAGLRVSLLPLGDVGGVRTEGLRYPLRDEDLPIGPARGVSNEFAAPNAQVSIRSGLLLAMIERELQAGYLA
ncbi:thiamine diphosphokinase [Herpetosiphon sp. NSE202]|uniref:thiamine diphosphokinase n=1 Tax=Herpetosiphon sp. NSE202 TaxID=3351349 RepID=UPI00364023ED